MPGRGLEDIERGHQNFWAVKGGTLKILNLNRGALKTTKLI